ncbi:MAG: hypothetical protein JW860_02365 [Sedimentisphaerales bacterium]|nr:hypothetical protein [Sedimentisphaerales bacterium]
MSRKTVLIIKHGFSETCDHNVSPVVSYGEVFRCTCLLEDFKGYHVTWITAKVAHDLLMGNHLIDELILADTPEELPRNRIREKYHMVINLEKQKDWCEFAAGMPADKKFGFKDWTGCGDESFYPESVRALSHALQRDEYRPLQETLFKTIGHEWTGQRYVLGYQPKVAPIYDIGLNNHVGPKWPTKRWPQYHWQKLYFELSKYYTVCWQQSLSSIRHYIDWLASCKLIITCDSLGLHLSLGLNKKIVALFGSTPPEQVYMYGCGLKLTPACERRCMPCFGPKCRSDESDSCMAYISVEMVMEAVESLLPAQKKAVPEKNQPEVEAPLVELNKS